MTTTAATTGKTRFTLVKKYCKAFINLSLLSTSDSSPGISRAGAIVPTKIIRKIPFRNLIQKFCKYIFSLQSKNAFCFEKYLDATAAPSIITKSKQAKQGSHHCCLLLTHTQGFHGQGQQYLQNQNKVRIQKKIPFVSPCIF